MTKEEKFQTLYVISLYAIKTNPELMAEFVANTLLEDYEYEILSETPIKIDFDTKFGCN